MAATLGELIAQGALPADISKRAQDIAQGSAQQIAPPPDMRAEQQSTEQAQGDGGEVTGAATGATSGISQSASADAIERVRRRVADETQAMQRVFCTPFNGR